MRILDTPLHVLVVEDNKIAQKLTVLMLNNVGCEVKLAATVAETMTVVKEKPFDVVLLDIRLTDGDGRDIARTIRAQGYPTAVIVGITANISEELRDECLAAGMNDCVSKPLNIQKWQQLVGKYIG